MKELLRKTLQRVAFSPLYFFSITMFVGYGVGFIIAIVILKDTYVEYALLVGIIIIVSMLLFWFGWKGATRMRFSVLSYRACSSIGYSFLFVFLSTAGYIFYHTTPALLSDLLGSDLTASQLRANATKGKSGIDSLVNGLFYASSYIGVGFVVLLSFYEKKRFRVWILVLAILLVMLNGQKSRLIIPLLPVLILFLQRGYLKEAVRIIYLGGAVLVLALVALNFTDMTNINDSISGQTIQARLTTGGRDLFEHQNPATFIVHRVVWIPFITAIDWLRYIDSELQGYLMGGSIPVFSNVMGLERMNLDNEVFKYQADSLLFSESTGAANSYFAFDLIANFGYLGLLLITPIIGGVFGVIWKGLPAPFSYIIFVWLFSLRSSSFHAILLGGGGFFILIFILLKNILRKG